MRQVSDFMRLRLGEQRFIALVGIVLIISGLFFLLFALKHRPNFINILVFTLVLIVGLALCWRIKIPIERVHILEYGILGWLAGRDLFGKKGNVRGIIFACAFAAFIGILDEAFQAILPYRYFDVRDIVFNGLGGVWGVSLYWLGRVPLR